LVPANEERFNNAFKLAKKEKIKVAYSNEAFELWFLLNFTSIDPSIPRARTWLYEAIQESVRQYNGYDTFAYNHADFDLFPLLMAALRDIGNEEEAVNRANQLLEFHAKRPPIEANPSTTVHLLVKELRDWITFFS